jgi:NitT/TauT family transport system substrate-binding protein
MPTVQSRRHLLANIAVAGATGFAGLGAAGFYGGRKSLAAEDLLRAEGFTDIRFVDLTETHVRRADTARSGTIGDMLAHGEVDFGRAFSPSLIMTMEAGAPITVLAGLHLGCFEVFDRNDIRAMADLKGRTFGISSNFEDEVLVKIMVGSVGLDPTKDIHWVSNLSRGPMDLFVEGKIDAFLAAPPDLQEVRARNIGHVIVSSIADRLWSQYYCCFFATRAEFARAYPVATKRVLRAILKAADLCASQPARIAQLLVDKGYTTRYDYALQALSEIRYDVWRDYDPEDTLRFYALRMHEAGMIKSDPQKLIAEHTDWRFLNELKREIKT